VNGSGFHPGERRFTGSTQIACPPAKVFEVLTDVDAWYRIDPALVSMTPDTPLAAGSAGTMRRRAGPMTVSTAWRVTDLDASRRVSVRIVGIGYVLVETIELTDGFDGTTVAIQDRLWPTSWVGRLLVPLSGRIIEGDIAARARRLKAFVETGSPDPTEQ
jgi:hypothetical protein